MSISLGIEEILKDNETYAMIKKDSTKNSRTILGICL